MRPARQSWSSRLAGLSGIKFRDYWLATLLGIIPGAAVAAFFGDSLREPFSAKFVAALVALVLLTAVPVVYLNRAKVRKEGGGSR